MNKRILKQPSAAVEPLLFRTLGWVLPLAISGLVVLAFRSSWLMPLMDPDLWWQIWAGEQILAGEFPNANALSWTAPGERWVSHEPLIALLYAWAGIDWLWLVRGMLVSAAGLLLLGLGWRRESVLASCAALLWALFLYQYGVSLRALTWGNLLLGACVALLFRVRSPWRLPAAVLLVWLWAQVHGSFVLGVFLLLLVDWRWAIAAAILTLINPNGLDLWALVIGYGAGTGSEALVHQFIEEWRPLWTGGWMAFVKALALIAGGALLLTGRAWRPKVIFLVLTLLAIRHQRYTDVVAIACLPFVVDRLVALLPARRGRPALPFACGLFALLALVQPRAMPHTGWYPPALPAMIPEGARLFNDFRLGGYLGWSGVEVFYDSRNDCYPPDILRDGFSIERQEAAWPEILARWDIDHVASSYAGLIGPLEAQGWNRIATFENAALDQPDIVLLRAP